MNRSESKYFNTAQKMDEALLSLLQKKDFEYITVKEICAAAGVNRSTFYLHYETVGDLLDESLSYMNRRFVDHMNESAESFIAKLKTCPDAELYLITPEYLTPYLTYIRDNRTLYRAVLRRPKAFRADAASGAMFRYIFEPILERCGVPKEKRRYYMSFYLNGIAAVIEEWLQTDCTDSVEDMVKMIEYCVPKKP